ncbi:serine hydrolase [Chryseobacterium sp. W4I1]|uniref:serine hydrolase domain-containing protein n=1 Tax=Chryseobacterium sp. W4I1 TaxID=3042293 RepID=UPI00277E2C28|nr:serine hydrolase domain-containing protein [Chryseobacterium sp. W4I1]MDQ0783946.1 D-alanyl-D-alanine carboxypeptidase [Chryseobacterium sp. W4I1]
MTKLRFIAATVAVLIISNSCEQDNMPAPSATHPNGDQYQKIVDKFMEAGAVGVSIAVISPQGTWRGSGGLADREKNSPMTVDKELRVGSMTKMFAATTILKLQEEGLLNIKDKINKYLPKSITDRIANANEVTIEQCLNHRAGIRNYLQDISAGVFDGSIVNYSAAQTLTLIYDKPADDPVGKGYYSNSNYLLLSLIITKVTGKPSYEVVNQKVINPLGLRNTFASTTLPKKLTRSYYTEDPAGNNLNDVTQIDNNGIGGEGALDGGMISTASNIARFVEALITGKILTPASMQQLETFVDNDLNRLEPDLKYNKQYGLGLMKLDSDQGVALGHDGHVFGFGGKSYYFPKQKTTICILLNTWSPKVVALLNAKSTLNLFF